MLHQIGAGALGPVFRAYEPELDKLVAVKVFQLELTPDRVHRVVAELEQLIAADLTHPSVAALLATGISGNSAYLAQDFVGADALDVAVREHNLPPPVDTIRIVTQLASALDSAASKGIFHGALHPRDVLVSVDDVRVTGLGIAQALERLSISVGVRRPYSAPERVAGLPWDRRADVFGLAAIAYELLSGKRVTGFGASAVAELPAVAGTDPEQVSKIFARALAEDPSERFETAGAFAEGFRFALAGASKPKRRAEVEPRLPLETSGSVIDLPLAAPRRDPLADFLGEQTIVMGVPSESLGASSPVAAIEIAPPEQPTPPLIAETVITRASDLVEPPAPPVPSADDSPKVADSAPSAPEPRTARFTRSRQRVRELQREVAAAREVEERPEPERVAAAPVAPIVVAPPPIIVPDPVIHRPEWQTGVWPIALAAFVGVTVGFALGQVFPLRSSGAVDSVASTSPSAGAGVPAPVATTREVEPTPAPSATQLPMAAPPTISEPLAAPPSASADPAPSAAPPAAPAAQTPPLAAAPTPPAAPPPALAIERRLTVRSTPSGARVSVNGRTEGQTPMTLRNLEPGTYTVRLTRDGFAAQERRVVINNAQPTPTITFTLVADKPAAQAPAAARGAAQPARGTGQAAARGSLQIESRPAGVRVLIDGKAVGTTPVAVPDLPPGEYTVTMQRDGYRTWTTRVTVVAGERLRVAASLETQQ